MNVVEKKAKILESESQIILWDVEKLILFKKNKKIYIYTLDNHDYEHRSPRLYSQSHCSHTQGLGSVIFYLADSNHMYPPMKKWKIPTMLLIIILRNKGDILS